MPVQHPDTSDIRSHFQPPDTCIPSAETAHSVQNQHAEATSARSWRVRSSSVCAQCEPGSSGASPAADNTPHCERTYLLHTVWQGLHTGLCTTPPAITQFLSTLYPCTSQSHPRRFTQRDSTCQLALSASLTHRPLDPLPLHLPDKWQVHLSLLTPLCCPTTGAHRPSLVLHAVVCGELLHSYGPGHSSTVQTSGPKLDCPSSMVRSLTIKR